MAIVMTISLRITRFVINQLTSMWYGASVRDLFFLLPLYLCEDCLIRDEINTCDDTIHNLSAYVCDWSLSVHKILHPILSLKLGVTRWCAVHGRRRGRRERLRGSRERIERSFRRIGRPSRCARRSFVACAFENKHFPKLKYILHWKRITEKKIPVSSSRKR